MIVSEIITYTDICCCQCGIIFMVAAKVKSHWVENKTSFYCPNGHRQGFYGDNEKDRLVKQLAQAQEEKDALFRQMDAKLSVERAKVFKFEKDLKAEKKKLKRVHAGVCPCCNRTFQNLTSHMKTKHPSTLKDFQKESPMHKKINSKA